MTLYRKYRPQKFSEVVGQDDVTSTLKAQLAGGKSSHAYLFIGPKGTGKTSTARIVAKVLNCAHPKAGEPDGKCASCLAITNGSHLDVIEIDAASNRGIEEIRDLREKIKLAPTQGKHKVYIIDEVHMLTTEAFNALLKTLEEPPAHAVFILCTTDVHKVPSTITSRCQRFEFSRASSDDLQKLVKAVAKDEAVKIDDDALAAVAQASDGSFRDALVVLEQAGTTKNVSADKVARVTRRGGAAAKLLKLLEEENTIASIELVSEAHRSGTNLLNLTAELVELMRTELLAAVKESNDVRQLKLTQMIRSFSRAYAELKATVLPTLPLELSIIEAVGVKERIVEEVVKEVKEEVPAEAVLVEVKEVSTVSAEGSSELATLKGSWDQVLKSIKPFNHSLEAFLRGCEPEEFTGKIVTLKFFYKFHKDMVDQAKNKALVEREIGTLLGREVRLKTILGQRSEAKKIRQSEVKNIEPVEDEGLVQKAVDIFNSGVS